MTQITHTEKQDYYQIRFDEDVIGLVQKQEGEYCFTSRVAELPDLQCKTMQELKVKVLQEMRKDRDLWKGLQ